MHHSKLLLFLLSLLIIASSAKLANPDANNSVIVNAELGSMWKNNPSLLHNGCLDGNFSMRLILPHRHGITTASYFDSVPSFGCGFFCAGPAASCDSYIFSIFFVYAFSMDAVLCLQSPEVVWSANRDRPVRENATVKLTELGDLVLYDADDTMVWSTNTADMSVVGMNLTEYGNLILLDHTNTEVWRSFDHPTDTLVIGQMLQVGQKLMASSSEANWAAGKVYLTVFPGGTYAFADIDTPLSYYRSPIYGSAITNFSAYIALKYGSLEVFTSFRVTEAPDYHIKLPINYYGPEFVRLDWNGHLMLYQWENNSWVSSDVFDITDPCSYPLACGEYGVSSDGQGSLIVAGFFELIDSRELNRGRFLTDSLSCGTAQNARFLAPHNTTHFNIIYNWTTNEERCKLSCFNDCTCKAAFFLHMNSSSGFCFLAFDIFSMISVDARSYSKNSAVIHLLKFRSTNVGYLKKE
ncbi:hypothetical protein EJB05_41210, partial [Eragrostis curvula]